MSMCDVRCDVDTQRSATKRKGSGRGKGSRIPVDVDQLLAYDGFPNLQDRFSKIQQTIADAPFNEHCISAETIAAFDKGCKALTQDLDSLHKAAVTLHNKILKRQCTPEEAIARVKDFRTTVCNFHIVFSNIAKRDCDPCKYSEALEDVSPEHDLGIAVCVRNFKNNALQAIKHRP